LISVQNSPVTRPPVNRTAPISVIRAVSGDQPVVSRSTTTKSVSAIRCVPQASSALQACEPSALATGHRSAGPACAAGLRDVRPRHRDVRPRHRDVWLGHRDVRPRHRDVRPRHRDVWLGHRDVRPRHRDVWLGHRDARVRWREAPPSRVVSLRQIFTVPTVGLGTDTLRQARRNVSAPS
jgi:hypothetical protein